MAIQAIENSKKLKIYGEQLGREGIKDAIVEIAKKIVESQNSIEIISEAGKIRALTEACKFDGYWQEKFERGFQEKLWDAKRAIWLADNPNATGE